jgi:hypothetical protein
MNKLPFQYAYFLYKTGAVRHELRVKVTSSLSLEWALYVDDVCLGTFLDTTTNILISTQLENALSYSNVERVYTILLNPLT